MCALWCCWCSSCDVGCACAFRLFPLSSLLFPLCAMVPTLLVWSVVVVPLSLCWCREVGVCGVRHGPVVLAKVLATPLVLCLGSVVCSVVLLFFVSRDVCLAT